MFVKAQGPDTIEDFDDLPYIQLFPDGVDDSVAGLPGSPPGFVVDFGANQGADGIDVKFTPAVLSKAAGTDDEGNLATPTDLTTSLMPENEEFIAYQLKIVLYSPVGSGDSNHSGDGLGPVIRRLRCAAIDTPRSVIAPPPPGENEGHVVAINTAKAWGCIKVVSGVPTILRSYNIESISRAGTGAYTVTLPEGNLVAKDADGDGDPDPGDPLNIVVLAEQTEIGGLGESFNALFSRDFSTKVSSRVTVSDKKLDASGKPSFTLRTANLTMTEYDSNDDGNGKNFVNWDAADPNSSGRGSGLYAPSGSEGILNFVVFGSNDTSSNGEGQTILLTR